MLEISAYLRITMIFTDFQKYTWLSLLPVGKSKNIQAILKCTVKFQCKLTFTF